MGGFLTDEFRRLGKSKKRMGSRFRKASGHKNNEKTQNYP